MTGRGPLRESVGPASRPRSGRMGPQMNLRVLVLILLPYPRSALSRAGMHWKGVRHPPPSRAPNLRTATVPLTPSASFHLQPLWQPAPTACPTASGAASEVPSLPIQPWSRGHTRCPEGGGGTQ